MIRLPEAVRLRAQAHGDAGARWIAGLEDCVATLERDWGIRTGEVMSGGSESLVMEAVSPDGALAVLKIGLPGSSDLAHEAEVLRLARGRGYVGLIAHDDRRNAMLVERLGPRLSESGLPVDDQIEIICATLRDAWIPLESDHGFMAGAEKAVWLADFIGEAWRRLDGPCERATIDLALSFADEREHAHEPARCVLVHGDPHPSNTLFVSDARPRVGARCKFIDPDGLFAEPAYDLGIVMRDWSGELLAGDALALGRSRCASLSARTGLEEHAIWQWGFVERVSTGLHVMELGMQEEGAAMLAVAERWSIR